MIESSDLGLGCQVGQNWVVGLARGAGFEKSGNWEQFSGNPLLKVDSGIPCGIQYPRIFADAGNAYISYWTLGQGDVFFQIAQLKQCSDSDEGIFAAIQFFS